MARLTRRVIGQQAQKRSRRKAGRIPVGGRCVVSDGDKGPCHPHRSRADRFELLCRRDRGQDAESNKDGDSSVWTDAHGSPRSGDPMSYPTITAAAITVVHKPFLLPTAV